MTADTVDPPSAGQAPQASPGRKRGKLRQRRTARACDFCRKRKVRCSGTLPCEYCIRADIPQTCEYGQRRVPRNPAEISQSNLRTPIADSSTVEHQGRSSAGRESRSRSPGEQQHHDTPTRRNSFEPPQMFAEDQHVGPTAGISFLYHPLNNGGDLSSRRPRGVTSGGAAGAVASSCSMPLDSYGDYPQSALEPSQGTLATFLTPDQISVYLERYFRFATPTYRYMHRPTLEKWSMLYVNNDPGLGNAQRACVLLTCAQSLLFTVKTGSYVSGNCDGIMQSRLCFQKAKELLDRETGPPSLASVQSRLAMCLYMLSTFRMTACRFCFSLTATILTSLGLHREQSTISRKNEVDSVDSELRKRTFWSAYVLDGYLSVMLGRPRIFRDEDVDQPYPRNVDDNDLTSTEPIDDIPQHGNLEAFQAHASLAKLMARNSDLLYPLHTLTEEQVLQRSNELLDSLESWRQSLPKFLKPGNKTLTGERMFERQNTVLKLAHAHLRILMTRRCLLSDASSLGHPIVAQSSPDPRTMRPIQECVAGMTTVLDTATNLVEQDSLFHCFWFTQYIALVAASTLYIFLIQGTRQALPASMESFIDVRSYFDKAKKCQSVLESLAPPKSQAKRHCQLLNRLRCRVERVLAKNKKQAVSSAPDSHLRVQSGVDRANDQRPNAEDANAEPNADGASVALPAIDPPQIDDIAHSTISQENFDGTSEFTTQLNPTSDADQSMADMLGLGWASLDTIGFMIPDDGYDFGE